MAKLEGYINTRNKYPWGDDILLQQAHPCSKLEDGSLLTIQSPNTTVFDFVSREAPTSALYVLEKMIPATTARILSKKMMDGI